MKKKERIIAAVRSRLKLNSHRYGIKISRDLAHAKRLDLENSNTLWQYAYDKVMYNVTIAFEILENDKSAPMGWIKTFRHLIWDLNMDFTRKSRWVKDRH